jgi:hypothetical protein
MTYADSADQDIFDVMQYVGDRLRQDEGLRRDMATAVRRKDASAMRKVARLLWKAVKWVSPIAFSVFLGILGIPTI